MVIMNKEKYGTLKNISLNIKCDEFINENIGRANKNLTNHIKTIIPKAKESADPYAIYRIAKLAKIEKERIKLDDGTTLNLKNLSIAFKYADYAVVFICTLGKNYDSELSKMSDPLSLYLFDSIGTYFTEQIADHLQAIVSKKHKTLKTTLRFSPGYCSWKIKEQRKVFKLLKTPDNKVKLNNSCMMIPKKSVSGIFGLVKHSSLSTNPCRYCTKKECSFKR